MAARFAGSWTGYHARVSPGRTALADLASGRRLSYAELESRVARLAGALAGGFGVRHGDRVAMLSRNCAQAFELMYACARLGAIFVPLNVRLSDPELDALAGDAAPALLLGEQALGGRAGVSQSIFLLLILFSISLLIAGLPSGMEYMYSLFLRKSPRAAGTRAADIVNGMLSIADTWMKVGGFLRSGPSGDSFVPSGGVLVMTVIIA